MAFTPQQLRELRAEVGDSTREGVDDDGTLFLIYAAEGESNVLLTAWFVWKKRLADLDTRSFDVTTGGSLMSRRQRIAFIQNRISELEFSIGAGTLDRSRATQDDVLATEQINALVSGTELT